MKKDEVANATIEGIICEIVTIEKRTEFKSKYFPSLIPL